MFLLRELIFLSPLVVYVYFSIRRFITSKTAKGIFTAFYILLLLAYPIAERLAHSSGDGWKKYAIIAGYYSLPFLLYLTMAVILADLAIGAARLFKIISREAVRSARFKKACFSFLLAIPAFAVILGIMNYNYLRCREYTIEIPRKSSSINRLKIVFAADLHLGRITPDHFLEKFVAKVNAQRPDIILIGGDVLEGDQRDEDTGKFETQFRRLESKYGVYAVPGNHEGHRGSRSDFFDRAGIRFLQDAVEKIDEAVYLAGRKDSRSRNRKSVDELLRNAPDDLPVILLAHRPIEFEEVSRSPVNIQLSGHTHNGQLFPVNFISRRIYELSWGYLKKRQTHFFVTSGVQLWGPQVRTAGASEILVIQVVFRENS
jgi:predicted MPP superfamily phosphohydrolase